MAERMSEYRPLTPADIARIYDVPVWLVDPSAVPPRRVRVRRFVRRVIRRFK